MQQLLASVFMSVGAALAIIALDGSFIAVNPTFSRSLRYGAGGLYGSRFWDLISDDTSNKRAIRPAQTAQAGEPDEFDARLRCGDGSSAQMHVSVTSVDQPQFKSFRLVAIRELPTAVDGAPSPTPPEVVVAGNIQLVGLDHVKAALGTRWAAHAEKAMLVAETILRNRLGPEDVFSRTEDQGFVICFAEGGEREAAFRAAIIAREIRNRLIGDSDDPAGSSVTAVTLSVEVEPGQKENGRPALSVLAQRLKAARAEAERRARAELSMAMAVASLEPEPLFDNFGKAVPINFVRLPQALQEQIDVALATLPATDEADADLDVLKLTLTAEAALADVAAGRNSIYLLPVDFALFTNRKLQEHYIELCRNLQDVVRQRLIFMLSGVPRTASQSRLFEVIRLLKPFSKGIGMDLQTAEFVPTDITQYRVPLAAIGAAELLDTARTVQPKLARFIRQLRLSGTRLIARQVHGEVERSLVTGLGADLVSFGSQQVIGERGQPPRETEADLEAPAFAAAVESAHIGIVITDFRKPDNPIASCNPAFTEITGYRQEEANGRNWRFLHGRGTDRAAVDKIREAVIGGTPIRQELLLYRKDGTSLLSDLVIAPVRGKSGELVASVGLVTDITSQRRAETNRRAIAKLLDDLVENIPGFIFQRTMTAAGQAEFNYLSPSFKRLIGVPVTEPLSKPYLDWVHPEDLPQLSQVIDQSAMALVPAALEYRLLCGDGAIRWVRASSRPTRRDDGTVVWNGVVLDITSEKTAERQASYLAGHDPLTGVANRQLFRTELCELLVTAQAEAGVLGVLSVDISDFAELNSAFGPAIGDKVLKIVAHRLSSFGGVQAAGRAATDVFALALSDIKGPLEAIEKAQAICREIAKPIDTLEGSLTVLSAIGLALYPDHAPEADASQIADALIKAADIALFAAKRAGPGSCQIYAPQNDDRIRNRAVLQQSLHTALARSQFTLNYQPVVELNTGRILGAEALIRWQHPELGLQRPDQFIPLAEKSGLIVPIGTWVLEEVIRDLKAWEEAGVGQPRIAINVAAAQLQHPDSLQQILDRIVGSGIDPQRIELELTESEFIEPTPRMLNNLDALRAIGVTIAIDDFGTGYSSFRYLRSLPIDKLKIDQSFVRPMVPDSGDEAIVRGMIAIGRDLGLTVVAEGVETAEQRNILISHGCKIGQGYFYSMPVNPEDFGWMLGQRLTLPMTSPADDTAQVAA